jgi:hypothetical protein
MPKFGILGIDPGIHGVLAIMLIDANGAAPQLIDACDIPVTGIGAKERVDAIAIRTWLEQHKPQHAYIERARRCPSKRVERFQVRARRRRDRGGHHLLRDPAEHHRAGDIEAVSPAPWQGQGGREAACAAVVSRRARPACQKERPRTR